MDMVEWLLTCDEPWTRYRTLVDLLGQPEAASDVRQARADMLAHLQVQGLIARMNSWPGGPITRHNDATHVLVACTVLADFGLREDDPGLGDGVAALMAHQSPEGAFQSVVLIPKVFGGTDTAMWTWVLCDAPAVLYVLLAMGRGTEPGVQQAAAHLAGLAQDNGWGCVAAPELGKFKGPGKRSDPCPIANVLALKALSQVPAWRDSPAARAGAEMLLSHWAERAGKKYFLFGIGSDFHKLKYPFLWYDILHVAEVLSHFPFVHTDGRFHEMVNAIAAQADDEGRYTARSMYRAWTGWSFADKKRPSAWLTLLALRLQRRAQQVT